MLSARCGKEDQQNGARRAQVKSSAHRKNKRKQTHAILGSHSLRFYSGGAAITSNLSSEDEMFCAISPKTWQTKDECNRGTGKGNVLVFT